MSTRCTAPHAAAAGSTRCATLWVPNVTVTVGRDVRPVELAGVDVDAARGVHRDDRDAGEQPRARARRRARSPGRPPIPTIPSTTTSGRAGSPVMIRPARLAPQRGDPALVRVVGQQPRLDLDPAPGQQRAGVQRVPAVVARPDQQQRPAPVRRPEQVDHGVRQPGRGPLHQRALRQPRHQLRLGRPHLLDRVRAPHGPTRSAETAHGSQDRGARPGASANLTRVSSSRPEGRPRDHHHLGLHRRTRDHLPDGGELVQRRHSGLQRSR